MMKQIELEAMRARISLTNPDFEVRIDNDTLITQIRNKSELIEMVKSTYHDIYDVYLNNQANIVWTERYGGFTLSKLEEFFEKLYYNNIFVRRIKPDAFVYDFNEIYVNIATNHKAFWTEDFTSDFLFNMVRPKVQLLRTWDLDRDKHYLCFKF